MLSVVINYYVVKGWKLEKICSFHVFLLVQEWKFGFLFLFYNILFHSTQDYRRLPTSYMKKNCKSGYKNFVCPQQGIEKTVRGNLILFLIKKKLFNNLAFRRLILFLEDEQNVSTYNQRNNKLISRSFLIGYSF